jgi:hypothetical protein
MGIEPLDATRNAAMLLLPATRVIENGLWSMFKVPFTVNVATALVIIPKELLNETLICAPLSAGYAVTKE